MFESLNLVNFRRQRNVHQANQWWCVIIMNGRNTGKNTNVVERIPNFEASFTIWTLLKSCILRSFKVCPSADVFF